MAEALAAVARDGSLNAITINDGQNVLTFTKNGSGNYTSPHLAGWTTTIDKVVPVAIFHIDADNNISAALDRALRFINGRPAMTLSFPKEASLTLSRQLNVPSHIKLAGHNSLIRTVRGGRYPEETALFLDNLTRDVEIDGLRLDLADTPGLKGIHGYTVADVSIRHGQILNVRGPNHKAAAAISFVSGLSGPIERVLIENNLLQASLGTDRNGEAQTVGIRFNGALQVNPAYRGAKARLWQEMTENGFIEPADPNRPVRQITIKNNIIDGGYYGIEFSTVSDSLIAGNHISNNVRNISLQNHSARNQLRHNLLTDAVSASVHLAYQSDDNVISGNAIASERSTGQPPLQAYQASKNNVFELNRINSVANASMNLVYVGPDSSGVQVKDNLLSGRASKAAIAVESVWDSQSAGSEKAAYAQSTGADDPSVADHHVSYKGGHGSLDGVHISGNILAVQLTRDTAATDIAPLVYVGADTATGLGSAALVNKTPKRIIGNINNLTIADNPWLVMPELRPSVQREAIRQHRGTNNPQLPLPSIDLKGNGLLPRPEGIHRRGDTVYSNKDYSLQAGEANLVLLGESQFGRLGGGITEESNLNGSGNDGANRLLGNGQANQLNGGGGDDQLDGNLGNDTLTGGPGADSFIFASKIPLQENRSEKLGGPALEYRSTREHNNLDTITDFNAGEGDSIGLARTVFGELSGNWFVSDPATATAETRVIYQNGTLYHDPDGSGSRYAPQPFALLSGAPALAKADFRSVAVSHQLGAEGHRLSAVAGIFARHGADTTARAGAGAENAPGSASSHPAAEANPPAEAHKAKATAEASPPKATAEANPPAGAHKAKAAAEANPPKATAEENKPKTEEERGAPAPARHSESAATRVDLSQHFQTPDELRALIDRVKAEGGSALQLRLSSDDGYVLESEALGQTPATARRTAAGTYENSLGRPFYGREQLAALADYARRQHVELIAEVDFPGAAGGIYQLLKQKDPARAERLFRGNGSTANVAEAGEFVREIYDEVLQALPGSRHFHLGGAEFTGQRETSAAFLDFVSANGRFLQSRGVQPRLWNDGVYSEALPHLDRAIEIEWRRPGAGRASGEALRSAGFRVRD